MREFNPCQITRSLATIMLHMTLITNPFGLQTQDQFTKYLSLNLPSDESIMEAMNVEEIPWLYIHHRSYFFPDIQDVEDHLQSIVSPNITTSPQNPILTHHVLS